MRAVLTFHSIDDSGSVVSYPEALFDRLLASFRKQGVPIVSLEQLLASPQQQGVALTFDDGMRSVFTHALPVLQRYDATAHVFITTNAIGRETLWPEQPAGIPGFEMLSWDEVEQLHAAGIHIEGHTLSHPDLRTLSVDQIQDECEQSDAHLERVLGKKPDFFAYPFGYHNAAVRECVRQRYRAAVTTELRYLSSQEDQAALPRLDSYYLQQRFAQDYLDSPPLRGYLWLRWLMRSWRGSHCVATS